MFLDFCPHTSCTFHFQDTETEMVTIKTEDNEKYHCILPESQAVINEVRNFLLQCISRAADERERRHSQCITFLPKSKILELSELKGFADYKINMTQKWKFVLERVENIVGKGENAGYQHFLLFPQCFPKGFFFRGVTCQDCVVKGENITKVNWLPENEILD